MPVQTCPACDRPTVRLLDESTKYAAVNYYRCERCGHVWTTSKEDGSTVKHVTPLTKTKHPTK